MPPAGISAPDRITFPERNKFHLGVPPGKTLRRITRFAQACERRAATDTAGEQAASRQANEYPRGENLKMICPNGSGGVTVRTGITDGRRNR